MSDASETEFSVWRIVRRDREEGKRELVMFHRTNEDALRHRDQLVDAVAALKGARLEAKKQVALRQLLKLDASYDENWKSVEYIATHNPKKR